MTGRVAQVNISRGGIPKLPIPEAHLSTLGLAGDACAHPHIHGGPKQAILIISSEGIDELREQGFPVYAGALGENITTTGIDRRRIHVGQQWRMGDALVEITKLRAPCDTLSVYGEGRIQRAVYDKQVKAGDAESPRWGLGGFYASVLTPGMIRPGDPVQLLDEVA